MNDHRSRLPALLLSALLWLGPAVAAHGPRAGDDPGTPPGDLRVSVADGAVSLQAREASLPAVLAETVRQAGVRLEVDGRLEGRITLELDRSPLREALHRILRGRAFALRLIEPAVRTAGPGTSPGTSPSTVWVFAGRADDRPASAGEPAPADGGEPAGTRAAGTLDAASPAPEWGGGRKLRLAALGELIRSGDDEAVEALATDALAAADPAVRAEAVYGLGEVGGEAELATLRQALGDAHPRVREAAIGALADAALGDGALGGAGSEDAAWALAPALSDPVAAVRERAVYALSEIGGEIAVNLLQQALADEQETVRRAAAEALAEMEPRERTDE